MNRNPKMVICRNCNATIAQNAKICPSCGAKNKQPFYKKTWFIVLVVIGIIGALASGDDGKEEKTSGEKDVVIEQSAESQNETSVTDKKEESSNSNETTNDKQEELVDGMRPEFKAAMDSYEDFYDEYCDFMKKYQANPTDMTLLTEYTTIMSKLTDMEEKFEAWDESEMNSAELNYYVEVSSRVAQKLLEVSQ